MVDSGILLIKYWLEVSADEQTRRLENRIHDPRKIRGPYEPLAHDEVTLPKRQKPGNYSKPDLPLPTSRRRSESFSDGNGGHLPLAAIHR